MRRIGKASMSVQSPVFLAILLVAAAGFLLGCEQQTGPTTTTTTVAVTHTVRYDGNGATGGTVPVDAARYLPGATVTVLANSGALLRDGYAFLGWNTEADGSGTDRAAGSSFAIGAADVVLYAKWIRQLMTMMPVPAGIFQMGSPEGTGFDDERPVHIVNLSGFLMSKYEVTQEAYQTVTGSNPSSFSGSTLPVEQVTWFDAVEFCNKLSQREGLQTVYTITDRSPATGYPIASATVTMDMTKNGYRLPTESEWEYAAHGGTEYPSYEIYSGSNDVGAVAWYNGNSSATTHPVGTKAQNGYGLHDMSGNVWEWCWDWYAATYPSVVQNNPTGAPTGTIRTIRGGSWAELADSSRVANRVGFTPTAILGNCSFRLARRP